MTSEQVRDLETEPKIVQTRGLEQPLLSVILFVRNMATTVEDAIRSVIANDYANIELIVLDGASTDGTQDVVKRYETHIAQFHSEPDGGAVYAINRGVQLAHGEVVCLLAGDDWFEPNSLTAVMDVFHANPELDLLSCGTCIVTTNGTAPRRRCYVDQQCLTVSVANIARITLTHGRILRRRAYKQIGAYNTVYRIAADKDFLLRAHLARLSTATLPRLVYNYRQHAASATLGRDADTIIPLLLEEIAITKQYLTHPLITTGERRSLLMLFSGATLSATIRFLRSGDRRRAIDLSRAAFTTTHAWLFFSLCWYAPILRRKLGGLAKCLLPSRFTDLRPPAANRDLPAPKTSKHEGF